MKGLSIVIGLLSGIWLLYGFSLPVLYAGSYLLTGVILMLSAIGKLTMAYGEDVGNVRKYKRD